MASQSDPSGYCIVTADDEDELRRDKKRKKRRRNDDDDDGRDSRKHRKREREHRGEKKTTRKDSKNPVKKSSKEKRKKQRGRSRSRSADGSADRDPDPGRVARRLSAVMRDAAGGKADSLGRSVMRLIEAAAGDLRAVDSLDSRGWSALHHACNHNDTACVQILLSAGADAALLDPLGNTPAHLAARHGNFELLEELLYAQRPADLDRPNSQGYSAREIAVEALEAMHLRSSMAVPLADAARKARHEQEWRDRMHDEMQDDWWGEGGPGMAEADEAAADGGGGFHGSASQQWHGGEEDDEEEWRANIVRGMRERQKEARQQQGSAAPDGSSQQQQQQKGAKQQGPQRPSREGQEEAQKHWRKVLEEEVEKDRQWRQKVLRGRSDSEQREKYEASWQDFLLRERPPGSVVYADVPWISPPSDSGGHKRILLVALAGIGPSDAAGRRKRIRMELMRWHPDKFTARFSKSIKPSELEAVLAGVTQTSAALTEADV